jgi:uncharacterized protein YkwD
MPSPTWTAIPTATPTTSGIPTTGFTGNGCAITPDQATGEAHVLDLLNADRAAASPPAPPLTLLPAISVASRYHSCDMAQHDLLAHDGSDGSTPLQRILATGVAFTAWGENVGESQGSGIIGGLDAIDQKMMAEPLYPPEHHSIIIDPAYQNVGIGVIYLNGSVWVTEDFVN